MPLKDPLERSKRKRASDGEKPQKKRRSSSSEDEGEDPSAKILMMEQGILESRKNYNNISVLLRTMAAFESNGEESMLAAVALCRVFVRLLAQGSLTLRNGLSERDAVVVRWLKEQFGVYKNTLLSFLESDDLAATALTLSMRALKAEGEQTHEKKDYTFPTTFLQEIVSTILKAGDEDLRRTYIEEYAEQFDDVRYYTFTSVK